MSAFTVFIVAHRGGMERHIIEAFRNAFNFHFLLSVKCRSFLVVIGPPCTIDMRTNDIASYTSVSDTLCIDL